MAGEAQGALWRWQHADAEAGKACAEPVALAGVAGWSDDDHCAALVCYLRSANLAEGEVPRPPENALPALLEDRSAARRFFEENFNAFRILASPGLLTSYFQPVLKGSRTPSAVFSVPVYRRPPGLHPLPSGHPRGACGLTAGRKEQGRWEPYFTRAEIESGALAGQGLEILYLDDAIDAFIMHVQGSGHIELDDGTVAQLSFDGKNGHPYTSIAKRLVERGHLTAKDADLDGMTNWLRSHPRPSEALNENESYIFFKEQAPSERGPKGSLGAELYAGRSLAADPLYHRPGMPIWISSPGLSFDGRPFQRLCIAQDTGSAIRGPQRGDIFAGTGVEARRVAGRIRHACEFIVMQPR